MRQILFALVISSLGTSALAQQTPFATTPAPAPVPATVSTAPGQTPFAAPAVAQTRSGRPTQTPPTAPRPGTPMPMPGSTPTPPVVAGQAVPVPPRPEAIPTQNVRVELTITDSFTSASPTKKTVTMLVADGRQGRIRSTNDVRVTENVGPVGSVANITYRPIILNVDAGPVVRADNRIQLTLSIEYVPEISTMAAATAASAKPANVNESLTVLVNDGKSTLISQSADPATDRKVTVEVTATIVK